ncbi:MAG: hypothetical protein IPN29_20375 [Saprospiraceae bacterium]|nr:hypothetical protein [Saprospiraceae bacterium]
MRFIKYVILLAILSCKTLQSPYAQPNISFYKSYSDFKKNNPLKTYPVIGDVNEHGVQYFYDSLKVLDKNSVKFITPQNYPSHLFSDNRKLLLRYDKGKLFSVLASGNFCYYMDFAYTSFVEGPDGSLITISKYHGEDAPKLHYYSDGELGDVVPLTNDFLYPILNKHKLMDGYEEKRKEFGLAEYSGEFSEVYIEVFELINQKTMR